MQVRNIELWWYQHVGCQVPHIFFPVVNAAIVALQFKPHKWIGIYIAYQENSYLLVKSY